MLILGEHDVHALLPMRECIEVMHRAFATLDAAGYVQPVRLVAWRPDRNGAIAAMPAWTAQPPVLGAKLISVFPQNRRFGLESHQGLVALYDASDGRLYAILHAGAITAIRTAAVSGVATRILADVEASTLAILGSGVQARTHLEAMLAVRPVRSVRVWSRTADHARAFAREQHEKYRVSIDAAATPREAIAGADIVCTVTASTQPIAHGDWFRAGAHVNAAGAAVPGFRELDTDAIARAGVYVDNRESAFAEADEIRVALAEQRITPAHVRGTLAELASGTCSGRRAPGELTIFKSVGMAVEDLIAARYVYERATETKRGTTIAF